MQFDYPESAAFANCALDPDEAAELIPKHIANHGQINARFSAAATRSDCYSFGNHGGLR